MLQGTPNKDSSLPLLHKAFQLRSPTLFWISRRSIAQIH